jgi:hypothetical protein
MISEMLWLLHHRRKRFRVRGCVGPKASLHINPCSYKEVIESRTSSPLPSELLRLIFLGCLWKRSYAVRSHSHRPNYPYSRREGGKKFWFPIGVFSRPIHVCILPRKQNAPPALTANNSLIRLFCPLRSASQNVSMNVNYEIWTNCKTWHFSFRNK